MEKPFFVHLGPKKREKYQQRSPEEMRSDTESQVKPSTHQETGVVVFPLVTTQFFSSGLIMVG